VHRFALPQCHHRTLLPSITPGLLASGTISSLKNGVK
jgi:hypothetical protein